MDIVLQNHSSYPCDDGAWHERRSQIDAAIHAQEDAGVDVVTDGQVGWADPFSAAMSTFEGVELGQMPSFFAGHIPLREPVISGTLRRRRSILADDFGVATRASRVRVKPVLPGPYTLARISSIRSGPCRDVAAVAHALSALLAAEVTDLVAAGAA